MYLDNTICIYIDNTIRIYLDNNIHIYLDVCYIYNTVTLPYFPLVKILNRFNNPYDPF